MFEVSLDLVKYRSLLAKHGEQKVIVRQFRRDLGMTRNKNR